MLPSPRNLNSVSSQLGLGLPLLVYVYINNMASPIAPPNDPSTSRCNLGDGNNNPTRKRKHSASSTNSDDDASYHTHHSNISSFSTSSISSTSKFLREDLEYLGIFYAKDPIPLNSLFEKLKNSKTRMKYPKFLDYFETLTKERITFSVDMNVLDNPKRTVLGRSTYLESIMPVLDKEISSLHDFFVETVPMQDKWREVLKQAEVENSNREVFLRLFSSWVCFLAPEFLESCKSIVDELGTMEGLSQSDCFFTQVHEGVFTNLITDFTKMMFLTPSLDSCYKSVMEIKGKKVSGVPDVLFQEKNNKGVQAETVLMIVEVKSSAILTPKDDKGETWIGNRLTKEVLGQIGSELLIKWQVSTFRPFALGILCMRTEIMFVLLEMKLEHLLRIQNNEDTSRDCTEIQYTKTFDIMKADDRANICKVLLWLANLQKHNFHRVHCQK